MALGAAIGLTLKLLFPGYTPTETQFPPIEANWEDPAEAAKDASAAD